MKERKKEVNVELSYWLLLVVARLLSAGACEISNLENAIFS